MQSKNDNNVFHLLQVMFRLSFMCISKAVNKDFTKEGANLTG